MNPFESLPESERVEAFARNLRRPEGLQGAAVADVMIDSNAQMIASAQAALAACEGETIAEIGPGSGVRSMPLARALGPTGTLHLLDHSDDMLARATAELGAEASEGPRLETWAGDCSQAPLPEACLDGLIAVNVLYFVPDLDALFQRIRGWLRPGGRVVFGLRSEALMGTYAVTAFGFTVRSADRVMRALALAGFEQVTASYGTEPPMEREGQRIERDHVVIRAVRG